jgi:hypothetical protein
MATVLYPVRKHPVKDYSKCVKTVVPNQSMSLKDILKRFVRRESLPIEHKGYYEDRFGDLEKLKYADFTVREERAKELKEQIAKGMKKVKEKEEKEAAEKAQKEKDVFDKAVADHVAKIVPPVQGGTPLKSPTT